jgi:hypothetical protein
MKKQWSFYLSLVCISCAEPDLQPDEASWALRNRISRTYPILYSKFEQLNIAHRPLHVLQSSPNPHPPKNHLAAVTDHTIPYPPSRPPPTTPNQHHPNPTIPQNPTNSPTQSSPPPPDLRTTHLPGLRYLLVYKLGILVILALSQLACMCQPWEITHPPTCTHLHPPHPQLRFPSPTPVQISILTQVARKPRKPRNQSPTCRYRVDPGSALRCVRNSCGLRCR